MNTIKIKTSQQTIIEQNAASIAERILSHLIDYLIIGSYFLVIILFFSNLNLKSPSSIIVISLPVVFYHLISEITMDGQSWGKKAMHIKVVNSDGSEPTIVAYLIRWAFRLVDNVIMFGGIGTLVIILNGKGKRLGDIAANTAVIRLKNNKRSSKIYIELPENYKVVFQESEKLATKDIYTIKEVIDYYKKFENIQLASKMAIDTKRAIEKKLGITSDLVPIEFLEMILMDYSYINQ